MTTDDEYELTKKRIKFIEDSYDDNLKDLVNGACYQARQEERSKVLAEVKAEWDKLKSSVDFKYLNQLHDKETLNILYEFEKKVFGK